MKKSLIAAGALALLSSAGAQAADIVTYQEQPAAAVAAAPSQVNWNGLYIGGTIGGSWANAHNKVSGHGQTTAWDNHTDENGQVIDDTSYWSGNDRLFKKSLDQSSFIGGIYAGYNFQPGFLSQSALKNIVFGIETDWLWNGSGESAHGNALAQYHGEWSDDDAEDMKDRDGTYKIGYKTRVKQDWNGATRLRAGYALGSEGRFMPYLAGGVSYAKIKAKSQIKDLDYDPDEDDWDEGDTRSFSKSKTRAGWNIGAGVDYVPPILNDHLVLRAEYRYTDFGTQNFKSTYHWGTEGDQAGNVVFKQKVKFNQNDFRVGVAYKF